MFAFFRRKSEKHNVELPPITLSLTNIREVNEAGILYLDSAGNLISINYSDAYKGWCKSKNIKKTKPKYICDRTKSDGWKLIFIPILKFHFMLTQAKKKCGLRL